MKTTLGSHGGSKKKNEFQLTWNDEEEKLWLENRPEKNEKQFHVGLRQRETIARISFSLRKKLKEEEEDEVVKKQNK